MLIVLTDVTSAIYQSRTWTYLSLFTLDNSQMFLQRAVGNNFSIWMARIAPQRVQIIYKDELKTLTVLDVIL